MSIDEKTEWNIKELHDKVRFYKSKVQSPEYSSISEALHAIDNVVPK